MISAMSGSVKLVSNNDGLFPLCIKILQLPFYDRVSAIDDLLLNVFGFILGYPPYLLAKQASKKREELSQFQYVKQWGMTQ